MKAVGKSVKGNSVFGNSPKSNNNGNEFIIKTENVGSSRQKAVSLEDEIKSRVVKIILERCDSDLSKKTGQQKRKIQTGMSFFSSSVDPVEPLPLLSDEPVVKKECSEVSLDDRDKERDDEYSYATRIYRYLPPEDSDIEYKALTLNAKTIQNIKLENEIKRCGENTLQMLFVSIDSNPLNTTAFVGWKKDTKSLTDQLVFQCLFCPAFKNSAKDISSHVNAKHKDVMFVINKKRPLLSNLLYMMCFHCDYASIDVISTWVHYAVYHRVPGILSVPLPRVVKPFSNSGSKLDEKKFAVNFPFYCCCKCNFISADCQFVTEHVTRCSFKDCQSGLYAPVIKISRPKNLAKETYKDLMQLDKFADLRATMLVCLRCDCICFNQSLMLEHHVRLHSSKALLFKCSHKGCSHRSGSHADMVQHFKDSHPLGSASSKMCCYVTLVEYRERDEVFQCI